jgi:hypothetical protein
MMDIKLHGLFTLRAPLSHIGEAISTNSYLVQEPVLQPDGQLEDVFCYSGNAWRGQLRDLAAAYMLDRLQMQLPLDAFHMLFSGGKIGGDQVVDLNHAKAVRAAVPMFSVFGGGIGNQIIPGKLKVGNCYPLCVEAAVMLPDEYEAECRESYRGMTFEKSFSRKDDAKNPAMLAYVADNAGLLDGPESGKKKADMPADQMRMTSELLAPGVRLYTEIFGFGLTEVELGALTAALHQFSRLPFIGGQSNKGHGKVSLDYRLTDLDSGETMDFLRVRDTPRLASRAEAAKAAYDEHLRELYDRALVDGRGEIAGLLGAG